MCKLHWHAFTRGHMHAALALPHASTRWCDCAMGTSTCPKRLWQMCLYQLWVWVNHPGRKLPKWGCRGCREDGMHEAPGPHWQRRCTNTHVNWAFHYLYSTFIRQQRTSMKHMQMKNVIC